MVIRQRTVDGAGGHNPFSSRTFYVCSPMMDARVRITLREILNYCVITMYT